MNSFFLENGFNLSDEQLNKFLRYKELLKEYNSMFNLTAITDDEEIIKKHFIDSLFGADYISGKLIDVGSGGGFPAIPLKIYKEDIDVTLLEATEKKCNFLNIVINELNLKNIRVVNGRAEDLAKKELREVFDCASARAVARLNTLLEYTLPFVKKGGKFVSYKGDSVEEVKECYNALRELGGEIKEVKNFDFYGAKRSIIVVEKVKNTPFKYPRGKGKERKNPL